MMDGTARHLLEKIADHLEDIKAVLETIKVVIGKEHLVRKKPKYKAKNGKEKA